MVGHELKAILTSLHWDSTNKKLKKIEERLDKLEKMGLKK